MKPEYWLPGVVFLVVSLPVLLLLRQVPPLAEFALFPAIIAGGLAAAFATAKVKERQRAQDEGEQSKNQKGESQ
ncbi:hypothetical protein [Piscinibacterium candidicorallinum]|jgi:hypothetical protein|uniref:Uncharacterized protein n=1 Tax=Piscinibacterium candidicorallinum TaxID=1793872 RepID=A0ABV7H2A8_9BURK